MRFRIHITDFGDRMPIGCRCIDGRVWHHDPQPDDPDLETDIGECPLCGGEGCGKAEANDGDEDYD